MWANRYLGIVAASLVAISLMGHSASVDPGTPATEEGTGFSFEWQADEADYAYLAEISTREGVTCQVETERASDMEHPSGLGTYSVMLFPKGRMAGSTSRYDDSLHAGPVNSAYATGAAWSAFWSFASSGMSSARISDGGDVTVVSAVFDADLGERNRLGVECNEEPELRFFNHDALEPVASHTATDGIGFNVEAWPVADSALSLNKADRWSIQTSGDRVFFHASDWQMPDPDLGDPEVEGEVLLRTPHGEESIPLDAGDHPVYTLHRSWTGEGEYELELDRIAKDRRPMLGVLAGFTLETEYAGGVGDGPGDATAKSCGAMDVPGPEGAARHLHGPNGLC